MNYLTLIRTTDEGVHRFYSDSIQDAVTELQSAFPVSPNFEQRLRNGETIETDQYAIVTLKIAADAEQQQQRMLFD